MILKGKGTNQVHLYATTVTYIYWKVKVKVVKGCIARRRVYTPLMRFSSLTRAADRTAAVQRTGRPGSPVSCTKVPTFRNPCNGLLLI